MAGRKLKKEEMRTDPFREFLARTFTMTEHSLERHWQIYIMGFVVVVAAIAGIYYYVDYLKDKRDAASALLSEIIDTADATIIPSNDPKRADYLKNGMTVFSTADERSSELKKKTENLKSSGGSAFQQKAASYLRASDLAKAGSYDEALKILETLEKDSHFTALALSLQARICEARKDTAKAESFYTRLSALKTDSLPEPMGLFSLADFYERLGKKSEALKTYESALKVIEEQKAKPAEKMKKNPPAAQQQQQQQGDSLETRMRERIRELKG